MNDLEKYGQSHEVSLSKRMNSKDNTVSFKLPNAFNKIYECSKLYNVNDHIH